MLAAGRLADQALLGLNVLTHRTYTLPLLIFYVTARCHSRCVTCNWWQAGNASDLGAAEIAALAAELPALRTRRVLFSGGEPLLRDDVFKIARLFRTRGARLELLTNGLLLQRCAEQVATHFDSVTLSLDADTPDLYRRVRGVDGLDLLERGVAELKRVAPSLPVRARSTLHRHNFRRLPALIEKARALGLAQISFLPADVSEDTFGRAGDGDAAGLLLDSAEVAEFAHLVGDTIRACSTDFESRFVAESPGKLRRLPQYYAAHLGLTPFPPVICNAPWMSAVVEADGAVRPCFFHRPVGNLRARSLRQILSNEMVAFRSGLRVQLNAVCARCVCALKVGLRTPL